MEVELRTIARLLLFFLILIPVSGWAAGAIFHPKSKSFHFFEEENLSSREWERLRSFLTGRKPGPPKFHLFADIGWALARGIADAVPESTWGPLERSSSSFNLIRRLRVEYSISRSWQFGYAFARLGEPSVSGYKEDGPDYRYAYAEHESRGHYLMVSCHPLAPGTGAGGWIASLGLGAGVACLDLRMSANGWDHASGKYFLYEDAEIVSKTVPSVLAFIELRCQLYRHLSVGVSADWTWAPSQEAPALPDVGLGARRVSFSSACVGFCLGLHL
jgi:hypothetical protein